MSWRDRLLAADTDAERADVLDQYFSALGEYVSSTVQAANGVALTSAADVNVTSITLSAGDWDVSGVVGYSPAAQTAITHSSASVSLTSGVMGGIGNETAISGTSNVPGAALEWYTNTPIVRVSVESQTTVYLVTHAVFSVSTMTAYGVIRARRAAIK